MTIRYQQERVTIILGELLFYRIVLHGEGHRESRILKVTLTNRANQLRNFAEPGRDYSIPVPSSIFYELSFFEIAAPKILI